MADKPLNRELAGAERRKRARSISRTLRAAYEPKTALAFSNPFELLIATILSAQCTDERVNATTPALFKRYPDAAALAGADAAEVEKMIHATGFFRQKTKSLLGVARAIGERHGGQVPETMEALTALPGVGRKTANVVRGCAMGMPGIIVDTHFRRVINRLGLVAEDDPDKIEAQVAELLPPAEWTHFSNALIWHGRRICVARKPRCPDCPVRTLCDYGRECAMGEGDRAPVAEKKKKASRVARPK